MNKRHKSVNYYNRTVKLIKTLYFPEPQFNQITIFLTTWDTMETMSNFWRVVKEVWQQGLYGVEYSTTIDMLKKIRDSIEAYIIESDDFAHPPEVATFVRIDKFNDSSIDIMVYCFTKTTVWGEWLKIKEALAYKIKETVEGAGTGFAFPSQSIYVESFPGDQAEVFVPPA